VVVFGTLTFLLLIFSGFFLGTFLPQAAGVLLVLRRIVELGWLAIAIVLNAQGVVGRTLPGSVCGTAGGPGGGDQRVKRESFISSSRDYPQAPPQVPSVAKQELSTQ
jgi:hypothetical protein